MRRWIAVGLLCVAFVAASQPPAPSGGPHVQKHQGHAGPAQHQPQAGQPSGTTIPAFAQAQATPEAAPETAEQKAERKQHAANERRGTAANIVIAIFTVVLAFVAAVQAALFLRQLKYMRESLDDTRNAFVVDHRPWVRIDGVAQTGSFGMGGADDKDGVYSLGVSLTNVGNSPATRICTRCLMVGDKFPNEDKLKSIINRIRPEKPSEGVTLLPGDFVSIYRVERGSLNIRDLKISLDPRYGHVE